MKTLDLDAIKAFVLTAELQSFTRAAQALDSTQSAVSLKLRRLEQQLGRRLLERTPRQVRLSSEGAAFLEAARELIGAHERAIASFEVEQRRLVIGISHQLVSAELPGMLRRMSEHDPNLLIELRAAGSVEIAEAYDEGKLDAALVLQPADKRHNGEKLYDETFAWIATADWQPRSGQPLPLSTQGASCSIRNAAVRTLDQAGIAWTEVFIGKGAAMVGAAAAAGLAIAVLPRRSAPPHTIDVGANLSLPTLPTHEVVLYSALHDRRSRAALGTLAAAFRSLA
ncbi:DNA-binding transcriptional regulator, LysR family [Dyella sp. OK004]|uniref:LysR family transcriptional regulator n=1 Tax=Dyella sp. OK004 TaxID=1855292 RepID=UPI0008E34A6F|nr:LysR substrate-binding domain-containing protein [Dyella sp. OK004]SFS08922.1 DNA-binding transcriptional regulator, LysR family [Dyella sp. OK004]